MSTTLIEQLKAIIDTGEISRAGLARAAGLHPNTCVNWALPTGIRPRTLWDASKS